MAGQEHLENWRDVDVGQIRRQLRLTVRERVRVMVEAANIMTAVQAHAREARVSAGDPSDWWDPHPVYLGGVGPWRSPAG